jgi:hypothetical protein
VQVPVAIVFALSSLRQLARVGDGATREETAMISVTPTHRAVAIKPTTPA